jgi:hypothetical protein
MLGIMGIYTNINIDNNDYEIPYMDPLQEYEDQLIRELCPDPDHMTYEQILELQEKAGFVNKGFTNREIEVNRI